jgi:vacuolar iron transporter family protein
MPGLFKKLTNFSFGGTSAIITNISLIVGLNSKSNIIGGLLVIALADNISDSLGIHIYQESETRRGSSNLLSTISNFTVRLLVSLTFILIILLLPIYPAQIIAVIWGIILLSFMTYLIARANKVNPIFEVVRHLAIAVVVIAASKFIGDEIRNLF